jgi:hypothetical protein
VKQHADATRLSLSDCKDPKLSALPSRTVWLYTGSSYHGETVSILKNIKNNGKKYKFNGKKY